MQADWELSQSLTSDGQGIRAACVLPPSSTDNSDAYRIIIGSQGGGLCEFGIPSGNMQLISFQHDHAVTALLSTTTKDDKKTNGLYLTGCKDSMIRVVDANAQHTVVATLTGHEKPVTSLDWCMDGNGNRYLVSGSWDGTAKVWDIDSNNGDATDNGDRHWSLIATLAGHENSVCVMGLPTATGSSATILRIATGSAGVAQGNSIRDHAIRVWEVDVDTKQTKVVRHVANDHSGPIRDISSAPPENALLASCSNDGTVKIRDGDSAEAISTLVFVGQQQTRDAPLLLSVTTAADTCIVAAAENGEVVVWDQNSGGGGEDGGMPTIIRHAVCVWKVVGLPNGDLATCCQDGTLRIFTRSTERMAPQTERDKFNNDVQEALKKQSTGPSADEISKLPRWENNQQHPGRSEGQVQVFNKDGIAIAAQWSAASQTWIEVGQVMGSNKDAGTIDGVQYDHVFPIELEQPGAGVVKLKIGYNTGENPFVAAQRFIDAHMLPQNHLSQIAEYLQQRTGQQGPTLGMDTGAPQPPATTGIPMASYLYLPIKTYKAFELADKTASTTLEKMKKKIGEFDKLSESNMSELSNLMETLAATNRYHAMKIQDSELEVIAVMLEKFPSSETFPGLDLARLSVLHPDAAGRPRSAFWDRVFQRCLTLCSPDTMNSEDVKQNATALTAIPMLSLRLFSNALRGGPGSTEAVVRHLEPALSVAQRFVDSKNKNIRLSVATFLHNVCFYANSNKNGNASAFRWAESIVVPTINDVLNAKTYESEALMRVLVALGTIGMTRQEAKDAANGLFFLASKVEMAASPHTPEVKAAAKEVYAVLQ